MRKKFGNLWPVLLLLALPVLSGLWHFPGFPEPIVQATVEYDNLKANFLDLPMAKRLTGPLFWQHGDETDQKNRDYVKIMQEGGNGHFTIESRPHSDWLGPGWYDDCQKILNDANLYGMKAYIFDEKWFPSFYVDNRVPAEHRARVLQQSAVDVTGPATYNGSGYSGSTYVTAIAGKVVSSQIDGSTLTDLTPYITSGNLSWSVPSGSWKIIKFTWGHTSSYLDLATQTAADWFVNYVVKPHYDNTGATNIAGFFYDEPEYHGNWGIGMEADFTAKGVDYKKCMVSRFYTLAGEDQKKATYEFYEVLGDRVGRIGYGTYRGFLNARGGKLIGHFDEDDWIGPIGYLDHGRGAINLMEVQKYSDMGGIDIVCDQVHRRQRPIPEYQLPKLASSISHINNKTDHLGFNEIYGGYGMGLTYDEMKWLSDWNTVQGLNIMVPHSFNPKYPDTDYPPYFYYSGNNPNWPLYKVWADRQNRLSYMLTGNNATNYHIAPVAFLFCGYSKYAGLFEYPDNMEMALNNVHYDYDMVTYSSYENNCTLNAGTKNIELYNERYRILVVPAVEYIPYATLNKIKQFYDNGGIVIGYGRVPTKSAKFGNTDADIQNLTTYLWNSTSPSTSLTPIKSNGNGGKTYFVTDTTESAITPNLRSILANCGIDSTWKLLSGSDDVWLNYLHRKKDGIDVFMVWNGAAGAKDLTVRLTATGYPEIWDPTTKAIHPAVYTRVSASQADVKLHLESEESLLVVFNPSGSAISVTDTNATEVVSQVTKNGSIYSVDVAVSTNGTYTTWINDGSQFLRQDVTVSDVPAVIAISGGYANIPSQYLGSGYKIYVDTGSATNARINLNGDYTPLAGNGGFAGGVIFAPRLLDVTGKVIAGNNRIQIQPTDPGDAKVKIYRKITVSPFAVYNTPSPTPTPNPALNAALAVNGATATASSTISASYPPEAVINGDRKGINWENGGGWNDGTSGSYPDWIQIDFSGNKTIGEIDVFTLQDSYAGPSDPTLGMTFSLYGITAFDVQYWNGSSWVTVTNGSVTGNNKVWRQFTFTPVTTSKIRVVVNNALANYSRIVEVEAWLSGGATPTPAPTPTPTPTGAVTATPTPTPTATATPVSGTNLALNKTVTASSSVENWGWFLTKVVDGQRNTVSGAMGWSSNNSPTTNHTEWVTVDLGGNNNINQVDLYPRNDSGNVGYGFPVDFTIKVSTDNTNWTTVITRTGYAQPGNAVQSFTFTSQNGRYVKVEGTSLRQNPNDTNYYRMQLAEVEVYASSGPTATPTPTPTPTPAATATPTPAVDQDDSGAAFSEWHDIFGNVQRLQIFTPSTARLPRVDYYTFKYGAPTGDLVIQIVALDGSDNPTGAALYSVNIPVGSVPTSLAAVSIYPNLTTLTPGAKYGILIKSPNSTGDMANAYGLGYSDSNPYANGYQKYTANGGSTWTTETSGNRDLKFTTYK